MAMSFTPCKYGRFARCLLHLLGFVLGTSLLQAQVQPQASIGFTTNTVVVQESDGSVSAFLFRQGNPSGTNTVRVSPSFGSGSQTPITFDLTTVTFLPGVELIELVLPISDNDARGANRPITLGLTAVTTRTSISNRYSAFNVTIPDDDAMSFRLATNAVSFREDSTNAAIEVLREGNLRIPASVNLLVLNPISPPNPRNTLYLLSTQSVDFAVSETRRSVPIGLRPLQMVTGPSTARILLGSPSTPLASLASPSNATLTVLDVDGTMTLGSTNLWVPALADRALIPLTKTGIPETTGFLVLEDGTAREGEDFTGRRIPFTLPESSNSISIEVPLLDNPARVHGRWFRAVLQGVQPLDSVQPIVQIWIPPAPSAGAAQARFQVDPSVAASGLPTNILALAPGPDNSWYLAGAFPPSPGFTASNILRITRTLALAPSWAPPASPNAAILHAAALPDGRLFVAGNFTAWGATSRTGLALLQPDGNLSPTGTTLDVTNVTALLPDARGRVHVSGRFTQIDGLTVPGLTRFSSSGDLEAFFRPNAADFGSFTNFVPLAPEGVALVRPDGAVVFLDDAGASNAIVAPPSAPVVTPRLTALPDASVRINSPSVHVTPGGSTDTEIASQLNSAEQIWSVPSGAIYSSLRNEMGWRLSRHWGDGTPDLRMEVWFNGPVTRLTEAADGTLLVSGSFTLADGVPAAGIAQLLPPPPLPGVRWHAGTGFTIGERARHARVPAWRETDLENAREIAIALPPSPALAEDAPASVPLRFDAGSRIGWLTVPLRNRTEAGPDESIELLLPEVGLTPGASRGITLRIFRDEQTFAFSHRTFTMDEPIPLVFTQTDASSRPRLAVRRLTGLGFPGSTIARFAGGTVRAQIGASSSHPTRAGEFDFFASTGIITLQYPAGAVSQALLVGPYDDGISQGDRTAHFTLDGPGPESGRDATLVIRDNDIQGPAGVPDQFQGYQVIPGVPSLLRSAGTIDGRTSVPYRMTAPDGGPISGPITPSIENTLRYIGPGPSGSHYIMESRAFLPSNIFPIRLLRHQADGSPDPAFPPITYGSGFRNGGRTVPVAMAPDGSLYALTREDGTTVLFAPMAASRILRRYGNDGVLVPGYEAQVYLRFSPPSVTPVDEAILLPYPDGHLLVVAGGAHSTNGVRRDIIRFLPSGAYDHAYRAQLTLNSTNVSRLDHALLDASNRCVVIGQFSRVDGVPRPGFARLTPTGQLDETFAPRFLASYPDQTPVSLRHFPGGRFLITLASPSRSTVLVLDDSGNPDPTLTPVTFDGWAMGASLTTGGAIVVSGDFQTVQGQTLYNEAWFDTSLRLLGTAPLALRFNTISPTSTQLTLDARATGTVTVEQGRLDGAWEPIGEAPVLPGANPITIPTPPGDHWFLRAIRR
jgi:hypothetical protein